MINANELRERMPKANCNDFGFPTLNELVEQLLPIIEKQICESASYGCHHTLIKRDELVRACAPNFYTKKQILDGVIVELKKANFKAYTPESYTSLHIEW